MANGVYTNSELVDTIIVDFNELLKEMINGQYIQSCTIVSTIARKLINLRSTIDNELKNRDETIKTLKDRLRKAGVEVIDVPAEDIIKRVGKDGVTDGE